MAIAFLEGQVANATASPVATPAFTNALAVGQLVVVYVTYDAGLAALTTSVTDSKGNTYINVPSFYALDATNNMAIDCWYAVVTTGHTGAAPTVSVAFNAVSANANIVVQVFNGFVGTPTFDKKNTSVNASSTTATSGASAATTVAAELVVGGAVHTGTVSAYSLGAGYTNLTQSSVANRQAAMESKVVAATGAQTATFTIALARANIGGVATFYDLVASAFRARPNPIPRQAVNRAGTY